MQHNRAFGSRAKLVRQSDSSPLLKHRQEHAHRQTEALQAEFPEKGIAVTCPASGPLDRGNLLKIRLSRQYTSSQAEPGFRLRAHWRSAYSSKEKIRFQSFFMLITTQAFFVALLRSASEKVPTVVSGRCTAGP